MSTQDGELPALPFVAPRKHITGEEKAKLVEALAAHYRDGMSVSALATATGRSVSAVNRLLTEGNVEMRPRGGARSGPRRATVQSLTGTRKRRRNA